MPRRSRPGQGSCCKSDSGGSCGGSLPPGDGGGSLLPEGWGALLPDGGGKAEGGEGTERGGCRLGGLHPPWIQCHHLSPQPHRVQALSRRVAALLQERRPQGNSRRLLPLVEGESVALIQEPEERTSATKS